MFKLFRNLLISIITWLLLGCIIFMVYGKPLLPYNNKARIDTGQTEVADDIMYDAPNIVYSASDYIKQSRDVLWEKAGLQIYYVAMYVPEDVSTEEDMLNVLWEEIKSSIYQDNGVYVCYSYYDVNNGDTRDDFFINNYLLFGDKAKEYCNDLFMYTYNNYYKSNVQLMHGGAWYTFSDCSALALKDTVESYTGLNLFGLINIVLCMCLFCILNVCTFVSYCIQKARKRVKSIVSLEDCIANVVETDEVIDQDISDDYGDDC